jgi:hypothetical protein
VGTAFVLNGVRAVVSRVLTSFPPPISSPD